MLFPSVKGYMLKNTKDTLKKIFFSNYSNGSYNI